MHEISFQHVMEAFGACKSANDKLVRTTVTPHKMAYAMFRLPEGKACCWVTVMSDSSYTTEFTDQALNSAPRPSLRDVQAAVTRASVFVEALKLKECLT